MPDEIARLAGGCRPGVQDRALGRDIGDRHRAPLVVRRVGVEQALYRVVAVCDAVVRHDVDGIVDLPGGAGIVDMNRIPGDGDSHLQQDLGVEPVELHFRPVDPVRELGDRLAERLLGSRVDHRAKVLQQFETVILHEADHLAPHHFVRCDHAS